MVEARPKVWPVRLAGAAAALSVGMVGCADSGVLGDEASTKLAGYASVNSATISPENATTCPPKKIVVLGSSTAAGVGADTPSNGWVSRYAMAFTLANPKNEVVNLAVSGETTYHALPDGSEPPPDRPSPDYQHNISAALALKPNAIIASYPSNDIADSFSVDEVEANLQKVQQTAEQAGIPIWIATPQPRDLPESEREKLIVLKEWVQQTFPTRSLNFWTPLAKPDGTIIDAYAAGDGTHLNKDGHEVLFEEGEKSNIGSVLCGSSPIRSQN